MLNRAYRLPSLLWFAIVFSLFVFLANLGVILWVTDEAYKLVLINVTYPLWDLFAALGVGIAAWCMMRQARRYALAWGVMALAPLCNGMGNIAWAMLELGGGSVPFPSVADIGYLAGYPLFLAGVLLMPAPPLKPSAWLKLVFDMLIVMLAAALTLWIFVIAPTVEAMRSEHLLARLTALAYPVGDLVLLWALLTLLYRQQTAQVKAPLLLLAAAFGLGIVADSIFTWQAIYGVYTSAGLLDLSWVLINLLYGVAGVWLATSSNSHMQRPSQTVDASVEQTPAMSSWLSYLPYVCAIAAYFMVELSQMVSPPGETGLLSWGGGLMIGLVLLRQMLTLRENQRQAQSLQQVNGALHLEIAEHTRAKEALSMIHDRYQRAIAAIDAVLYQNDYKTHLLSFVGEGIQTLTGYSAEEMSQELWDEISLETIMRGEAEGLSEEEAIRRTRQGEFHRWLCEARIRTRYGEERWVVDASIELYDEQGAPSGAIGLLMDITARKRAEAEVKTLEEQLYQAQKMEAVGKLAGGIAHDFNNLLTAIMGYTDLSLLHLEDTRRLRRNLEEIQKASNTAAAVTSQLLTFSRKQVLQHKVLDLNAIVLETETLVQRLVGEDVVLALDLAEDLHPIKADPGQIKQVLMNLVVNGREAMPQGGRLQIETQQVYLDATYARQHVDVAPGHYVRLTVCDTGMGMDEQTQKRIFEPFFTTKAMGKGAGLGLSIVYGIVKQCGGHIVVASKMDQGATFHIYLPVAIVDAPLPPSPIEPEAALQGTETIILAEDEEAVRNLAREVLVMHGYRVLTAANGGCALALCERHNEPIHLLLSDVVMPEMGGRALAAHLAPLHPDLKVIFMSGYTDDAIVLHGIVEEEIPFLQKPFTPTALANKVRAVLDSRQIDKVTG